MKKSILAFCAICLISFQASAQKQGLQQSFGGNDNVISLGVGFGGNVYSGGSYTNKLPFFSLSYERCIIGNVFNDRSSIGVGGLMGYASSEWKQNDWGWKYNYYVIGARGAFHYALLNKLDTYGGLMLGYNIVSSSTIGNPAGNSKSDSSEFAWSMFAGARYYFSKGFGAFAELGYGYTMLNVGLSFKF